MKQILVPLIFAPLLTGCVAPAQAGPTRIITTSVIPSQQECREFTQNTIVNNQIIINNGTACLYPDGVWRVVSSGNAPQVNYTPQQIVRYDVMETPIVYRSYPVRRPAYFGHDRHDNRGWNNHRPQQQWNRGRRD